MPGMLREEYLHLRVQKISKKMTVCGVYTPHTVIFFRVLNEGGE
jgi:hypothetical protein